MASDRKTQKSRLAEWERDRRSSLAGDDAQHLRGTGRATRPLESDGARGAEPSPEGVRR